MVNPQIPLGMSQTHIPSVKQTKAEHDVDFGWEEESGLDHRRNQEQLIPFLILDKPLRNLEEKSQPWQ